MGFTYLHVENFLEKSKDSDDIVGFRVPSRVEGTHVEFSRLYGWVGGWVGELNVC